MTTGPENVTNNTDFMLAPGEQNVCGDSFMTSLLAPYLKTQLMCSTTRFVYKSPNTLLGVIPVGTDENQMPIQNLAAVSSSSTFVVSRLLLGVVLSGLGLYLFPGSILLGLIVLLFGVSLLLTSFPVALKVTNPAGGVTQLEVCFLEAKKLKAFTTELQNRVFADKSQIQHDEAQSLRMMQAQMQQMQLAQMQQMNSQQMIGQAAMMGQIAGQAQMAMQNQISNQGQFGLPGKLPAANQVPALGQVPAAGQMPGQSGFPAPGAFANQSQMPGPVNGGQLPNQLPVAMPVPGMASAPSQSAASGMVPPPAQSAAPGMIPPMAQTAASGMVPPPAQSVSPTEAQTQLLPPPPIAPPEER